MSGSGLGLWLKLVFLVKNSFSFCLLVMDGRVAARILEVVERLGKRNSLLEMITKLYLRNKNYITL